MMVGTHGSSIILGTKTGKKRIVVSLKSHNRSREMLLRLLTNLLVSPGDCVLAIHVQESIDTGFDPNNFYIHEDLCKSKQVEFQIKVCTGVSFIAVLIQEVVLQFASILVLGCSSSRPKESYVVSCLQDLPSTCCLLVVNNGGRILVQQIGASKHSLPSSPTVCFSTSHSNHNRRSPKILPILSPYRSLPDTGLHKVMDTMQQCLNTKIQKKLGQLEVLESKGTSRQFTLQELGRATKNFSPLMVIGESGHSTVYRGTLKDGQAVAVKVLKITKLSGEELLQEVDMLSGLNHEHIVQLIGYCYSKDMHAVVYNLLQGSLKQNLKCLGWKERMSVAIGVAKSLRYLHHSCSPPIIHRDVKSANVLLYHRCHPQLSDFGTAMVKHRSRISLTTKEEPDVVGTFGYLAPEYVMYGKVNEKIDVYSYGVVLLELLTGKTAIEKNTEFKQGSLVLWANSLLSRGLSEQLIDPNLNEDYNKEEMQRMMTAAQLCLRQLSSTRPPITKILKLLNEPEYWVNIRSDSEEGINEMDNQVERHDEQGNLISENYE